MSTFLLARRYLTAGTLLGSLACTSSQSGPASPDSGVSDVVPDAPGGGGFLAGGGTHGGGGMSGIDGVLGSGGALGTGGLLSLGGAPGVGGVLAAGGLQGAGGLIASGGVSAVGGSAGAGGLIGSGGVTHGGGATGFGGGLGAGGIAISGGMPGSGGLIGSGGRLASGGASGVGGAAGSGGLPGSGGLSGSGGLGGQGGTTGTGGLTGAGGTFAVGGTAGTGGVIGSGGTTGGSGGDYGFTYRSPGSHSESCTNPQSGQTYAVDSPDMDWLCTFGPTTPQGYVYVRSTAIGSVCAGMLVAPLYSVELAQISVGGAVTSLANAQYDFGGIHNNDYVTFDYQGTTYKYYHSSMGYGGRKCQPMDCINAYLLGSTTLQTEGCTSARTRPEVCVPIEAGGTHAPLVDTFSKCPGDPNP